jgi:hypothetical protein
LPRFEHANSHQNPFVTSMHRSRRTAARLAPAVLFAGLLSCDRGPTSPGVVIRDRETLDRAVMVRVNLSSNTASATPVDQDGATLSLVGRDVIDATITGLTRASYNKKKDLVKFDVSIVNRIAGVQLVAPTQAPTPPNGTGSVFVFPYLATVTGGQGEIKESSDWPGAPFGFFDSDRCHRSTVDCFPWTSFPAPLLPGQASPTRTVGFIVDKSVTAFDVYLLTAADVATIPTGSLEVSVTSATTGALAAVKVTADESINAVTDATGLAQFGSIATGAHTISLSQLPAGCSSPIPVSATVAAAQLTHVDIEVACRVLAGGVHGYVRTSDNTGSLAGSGVRVRLQPSGVTTDLDDQGNYVFDNVPEGSHSIALVNFPAACRGQNPAAVTMTENASVEINYLLECPPPIITGFTGEIEVATDRFATMSVSAASPTGAPLAYSWSVTGGSMLTATDASARYLAPVSPGMFGLDVVVSDGVHTISGHMGQFAMRRPGAGVFASATTGVDGNAGTRERPVKTIGGALALAGTTSDIYLAEGTYAATATIQLPAGIGIYGGFGAEWSSTSNRSTILGASTAMSAIGSATEIALDHLVIQAANATETAASSIGLWLQSSYVSARFVHLQSGNGGTGAASTFLGADGAPGQWTNSQAGAPNFDPTLPPGGRGGDYGYCSGATAGESVGDAIGGAPGGGVGGNGSIGARGVDAIHRVGEFTAAGYVPGTPIPATDGHAGTSGAGGGGTNGTRDFLGCSHGYTGLGGGGGGGGGRAAQSSGGGGASVALYSISSNFFAQNTTLKTGNGGAPGDMPQPNAAVGGLGGNIGGDGNGGKGGQGGPAGLPAGGAGGSVAGVVRFGGNLNGIDYTMIELGSGGVNWNNFRAGPIGSQLFILLR